MITLKLTKRTWWIPYLFILPFVLSFILFFVVPSVYSFALSFAKYPGYGTIKWIGIRNYESIFKYSRFYSALWRTLFYWLAKFIPVTVISFMMAVCLKSKATRFMSKFYKPVLFLPQVCAVTATALMFQVLFANQGGAVNMILGTNVNWIENRDTAKWVVLIMMCWRSVGWFMVVYLSGLTAISPELHEAAMIDGASPRQNLFYITIPLMKQTFMFAFIMDAINSLRMYTEASVLTGSRGEVAKDSAEGLINLMMVNLNSGNFGMASAYGWLIFALVFIISMGIFSMFREGKGERQ